MDTLYACGCTCVCYLRSHHLTEAWWAAVWVGPPEEKQRGTSGMSAKEHGMTAR